MMFKLWTMLIVFLATELLKTVFQLKGKNQLLICGSFMHFREAFSLMLFDKNVEQKEASV